MSGTGKCLDHSYVSIKGAYKSLWRAPLGKLDYNTVWLIPDYKLVLKKHKPERLCCGQRTLYMTSKTASTAQIGIASRMYVLIWMISQRPQRLCQQLVILHKHILIYLNNKAWAKAVKNSVNHQNISFNQGYLLQYRQL